jgi:lipooligosaccharide transport system ATP-binding protein
MNIIKAKNLIKDYNSFRAVNDIDFEIQEGECFGFLGPNGAGKTTVMRILYCFMPPSFGTVEVSGINVLSNPSQIKSKIGVMPQEDNLDIDLTVLQNLIVYARYFDIPKQTSKALANELLEYVELEDKINANILSLSGGMKRSLSLARALINCPEIQYPALPGIRFNRDRACYLQPS